MSTASPVHKIAAAYWFTLSAWVVVYAWRFPDAPFWVFALTFAAFAVPEAWAILNKQVVAWNETMVPLRDTYSEVMTWLARFTKDGAHWYMWTNAIVVFVALHWGWLVMHQPESLALGVCAGALTVTALTWHWLYPWLTG